MVSLIGLLCFCFVGVAQAGIPDLYESLVNSQSLDQGLYNSSDKVTVLTRTYFNTTVLQHKYASLVEFYNSYCGHCRRFAPVYKKLAEELFSWSDVLKICAIDCATEENNEICREYEIMAYPSLRYFGLNYQLNSDYGKPLESQDIGVIRTTLANWIASENTSEVLDWPNFQSLSDDEVENPFFGLSGSKQYLVLVYEPENSTVGTETILHFQRYPSINVRKVKDLKVAAKFQIDGASNKIAIVDRKLSVVPYSLEINTTKEYRRTIEGALNSLQITEETATVGEPSTTIPVISEPNNMDQGAILKEIHSNKHLVYQADLEIAVRSTVFKEVPRVSEISGERLLALQRYLAVLKRYNPLGASGVSFLSDLYEFVIQQNQSIKGQDFQHEAKRLKQKHKNIFSAKYYIGCAGSKQGFRGFTCSLWQIFHYLTVQAATSDLSRDPLEVLQAIQGYVKHFFGCTDCSQHFQEMAARRKIWNTSNKDDAVIWLWTAHNEVNQRLAGDDLTEDPEFPKIQFPSQLSCPQCHQDGGSTNISDIHWNKDAVLTFLKNIHNPQYVRRFRVSEKSSLIPPPERLRQKRMVANVFSDMDLRMGMMLYGFCILMMVVAFKLFAFKGYRRKPYGHEILGKV